jgi:hypothetical protein
MTTIQPEFLKKLLAVAGEAFDRQISPALGRVYWEGLKHCEAEEVEAALSRAMRELKFFPRLAEILEFIEGSPRARAELSWAGVLELLRQYGAMKSLMAAVDGATAWAVERMGGMGCLALMSADALRFENKRYFALFEHAARQGLHQERAILYGVKERNLFSAEFIAPKMIPQSPATIAPPPQAPALEDSGGRETRAKINGGLRLLAERKAMP